jgi:hypothetical protein
VADATRITTDNYDDYTVTTDGGLSFSISGSKLRYAHPLSADLGTFEKIFPNAIANMRSVMKNLGQKEFVHLPLWMRTAQDSSGVPLGYKPVIVLAYCKPGQSALVRRRILDKNIDFKKISFRIDRYVVNAGRVDTGTITPDGSTRTFVLNEFYLTHDVVTKKTTINFTNAPAASAKITVERQGDKYLAFRRKLKE